MKPNKSKNRHNDTPRSPDSRGLKRQRATPAMGWPAARQVTVRDYLLAMRSDTVRYLRPLARRRASTLRPSGVDMRSRKPCLLTRLRLEGWNVLFIALIIIDLLYADGCVCAGEGTFRDANLAISRVSAKPFVKKSSHQPPEAPPPPVLPPPKPPPKLPPPKLPPPREPSAAPRPSAARAAPSPSGSMS